MIKLHTKNNDLLYLSEAFIVSIEPLIMSKFASTEISMSNGKEFRVKETIDEISELLDAGWNLDRNPNHLEAQAISVASSS